MELIELPETIKKQQKYDKIKLLIAGEVLKVRKFTSPLALDLCHYVAKQTQPILLLLVIFKT
jgi:hypothetical protein